MAVADCQENLARFDWERSSLVRERSLAAQRVRRVAVPHLRYVREVPRFSPGVSIAPNLLGGPDDLEDSEDCRSAGGHGNQHVRLRSAQIDFIETICPALVPCRYSRADVTFDTTGSRFQEQPSRPHRKISEFIGPSVARVRLRGTSKPRFANSIGGKPTCSESSPACLRYGRVQRRSAILSL
jgi:hypothetical protein